jgi:hypothetical protein
VRKEVERELSEYCHRFGKIAVDLGLISVDQLRDAMTEQISDDLANKPHRILGNILFDKGRMTYQQIEVVMHELFKRTGQ